VQDELAGVAAELVRYCDQLVPQSGDHDVVVADTHVSAHHVLTMTYPVSPEMRRELLFSSEQRAHGQVGGADLLHIHGFGALYRSHTRADCPEFPRIVTKYEALAMRDAAALDEVLAAAARTLWFTL
jgi:hypothetical protein